MTARQPWVIVMLILSALPALVFAVIMWFSAKMFVAMQAQGLAGLESPDRFVYLLIVKPYGTFLLAFLTALFAGGGAVADDARARLRAGRVRRAVPVAVDPGRDLRRRDALAVAGGAVDPGAPAERRALPVRAAVGGGRAADAGAGVGDRARRAGRR